LLVVLNSTPQILKQNY